MTDIYEYYRRYDESTRLTRDRLHRSEYLVMIHLLDRYLSPPPLTILDCCAGCGIYSFPLARKGYTVTAGDLIPAHADYLRKHGKALCDVYRGSVCDLSRFPDECFDVVLNFGAMYHLQEEAARQTALRECLRVLRPGGLFAYTYETLQSMLLEQYRQAFSCMEPEKRVRLYQALDDCRRTHCRDCFYGMTQEEIERIPAEYGLQTVSQACIYSVHYPFYREVNDFSKAEYRRFIDTLTAVCEEESVVRYAMHGVYFGRKG